MEVTSALAAKLSTTAKRRPRTTPDQSRVLNSYFARNPAPRKARSNKLPLRLRSSQEVYQNKRAAVKREAHKAKEKYQERMPKATKKIKREPKQHFQTKASEKEPCFQEKPKYDGNVQLRRLTFYSPANKQYHERTLRLPAIDIESPSISQTFSPYPPQPRLPSLSSIFPSQSHMFPVSYRTSRPEPVHQLPQVYPQHIVPNFISFFFIMKISVSNQVHGSLDTNNTTKCSSLALAC
ncbi:hypothetical protein BDF14DRAFT_1993516 [Spinellus fusiger]|nr:hypothetical protein BDF14DRAFT_1993516 [Spinellus fusiger]